MGVVYAIFSKSYEYSKILLEWRIYVTSDYTKLAPAVLWISYNGSTSAFQADSEGSIPFIHSI